MKIKEITHQNRRDFTAIYECENCDHEYTARGYDDDNFHENVIPKIRCPKCDKRAPDSYHALVTRYPEGHQI